MKAYSSHEEFYCSLRVDPAIRIYYKPIRKFQAHTSGFGKALATTYLQEIEINNTLAKSVKLLLSESLPYINTNKVHVKLIEPVLKKHKEKDKGVNVRLNKDNNLEFNLNIESQKSELIMVKYKIEQPSEQGIEFSEVN